MKSILSSLLIALAPLALSAQSYQPGEPVDSVVPLTRNLHYSIEAQGSLSHGQTPLWLNANKYGLSSLKETNGYLRASLIRPLEEASPRKWDIGYGLDIAVPANYTSNIVIQQAYGEVRWLHGLLTLGSKQYPMELKNDRLSSGAQTLGINARPIPQLRLALPQYWTLPILGGWVQLKGHIAYGRMTDDKWQHHFTGRQHRYADDVNYHSKAGYLKIGNEDRLFPWSVELGLEMASQFGGKSHSFAANGQETVVKGEGGLKGAWHAFIPGGDSEGLDYGSNASGNDLGSWLLRVNYDADEWAAHLYADHYFEDHSQMFMLDYDGYGSGNQWNSHRKHRYLLYELRDIMLGAELNIKYGTWLRDVVVEYIYTKYQSGPIYHDHTRAISDHISGIDNYYNHYLYPSWQHWSQVIGNPLYRSPIYNTDGQLDVRDNRFMAFHLGFDGRPVEQLDYRLLASWQVGYGTYDKPFNCTRHNLSLLLEAAYHFRHGWDLTGAYGMDIGSLLGHNQGFQLTIKKSGILNL